MYFLNPLLRFFSWSFGRLTASVPAPEVQFTLPDLLVKFPWTRKLIAKQKLSQVLGPNPSIHLTRMDLKVSTFVTSVRISHANPLNDV
jgi:hypothetical protein